MPKKTKPSQNQTQSNKRPPVVVVLGHVDHGKTTLLDYIRQTKVQAGEAGGITQHIGAYQVETEKNNPQTTITFIDTPGHEAFSKMRSRGAKVADLAILVVAANDGVKPQTKEAIAHIKKAQIPYLVAINKIDLEDTNIEIVKGQLAENEVYVEGYGGDVVVAPISARTGNGVDHLLEMLHLLWELQDLKDETDDLKAVVLESYVDQSRGVIANVLVRSGELNVSDELCCQDRSCRVRSLLNENSLKIEKAGPSQPAQILGFKKVLPIGNVITSLKKAQKPKPLITEEEKPSAEPDKNQETEEETQKLKIILKTDVAGTLEAIKANLTEEIDLVGEGIGDINESDVLLARSTHARLIGFNVKIPGSVQKLAEMEEIKIETFNIIYHLLEDLEKRVLKLLEPTINEEVLGKAEIIAEFTIHKNHIAGCKVKEGKIVRSEKVRIEREDNVIGSPRIGAMQIERKDAKEAKKGEEVALVFRPDTRFHIGDTVISYRILED